MTDEDIAAIANKHIEQWICDDKKRIFNCVTDAIREALNERQPIAWASAGDLEECSEHQRTADGGELAFPAYSQPQYAGQVPLYRAAAQGKVK